MVKMFKFFDVMNRGTVSFNEFMKTLEKTGMYFPAELMLPLF